MFLSTYENKLDKKGRVSVPASYRSYLSNIGYNGVVCFPSFNKANSLNLISVCCFGNLDNPDFFGVQ